jgi:very-short-patch-repair endonuclease
MAAALACGEDAVLSHRSAAAAWGIADEQDETTDVSVRRRSGHRRDAIRARSRPSLRAEDVARWRGIPVTAPARTLLDLATELSETALERAVNDADKLDLIGPEALRDWLALHRGEPGVRKLRALLDRHTFRLSDSVLESRFRKVAAAAGLPEPMTKQRLDGFEVDFYWPQLDLVVETDGLRYHRTAASQARDRMRDQAHTAAGRTILRFTHRQVAYEAERTGVLLAKTAELARGRQASIRG